MIFSIGPNSRTKRWAGVVGKMSFVMLFGFFVSACAGGDMESDHQVARDRVNAYLAANPATTKQIAETMRRYQLRKGMTPRQVVAVWGAPRKKKSWRGGEVLQWYFECDQWPNTCSSMGRRRGRSADEIYPQAFFTNGLRSNS